MQTSSSVPARLVNYFFEGVSTPQRFSEGLRLLAEALDCEQASVKLWDRRASWACLRKAQRVEASWQFIAEDLAAPPAEWQQLAANLEHGSWRQVPPSSPTHSSSAAAPSPDDAALETPLLRNLICLRLPAIRGAEALLLLRQRQCDEQAAIDRISLPTELVRSLLMALELMAQFRQLSHRASCTNALLDTIRLPLLMLDNSLRLLASNRHVQPLIERLSLGAGKQQVSLRGLSASRFAAAVRNACDRSSPTLGSVLLSNGPGGTVKQVLVLPIKVRSSSRAEWAALVLVHGLAESQASGQALLQQAYGLTPAEARLAMLILEGHSPGDAATTLQVRIATVRTQLSAILKKTGASKQSELIRRLSPLLVLDRQHPAH